MRRWRTCCAISSTLTSARWSATARVAPGSALAGAPVLPARDAQRQARAVGRRVACTAARFRLACVAMDHTPRHATRACPGPPASSCAAVGGVSARRAGMRRASSSSRSAFLSSSSSGSTPGRPLSTLCRKLGSSISSSLVGWARSAHTATSPIAHLGLRCGLVGRCVHGWRLCFSLLCGLCATHERGNSWLLAHARESASAYASISSSVMCAKSTSCEAGAGVACAATASRSCRSASVSATAAGGVKGPAGVSVSTHRAAPAPAGSLFRLRPAPDARAPPPSTRAAPARREPCALRRAPQYQGQLRVHVGVDAKLVRAAAEPGGGGTLASLGHHGRRNDGVSQVASAGRDGDEVAAGAFAAADAATTDLLPSLSTAVVNACSLTVLLSCALSLAATRRGPRKPRQTRQCRRGCCSCGTSSPAAPARAREHRRRRAAEQPPSPSGQLGFRQRLRCAGGRSCSAGASARAGRGESARRWCGVSTHAVERPRSRSTAPLGCRPCSFDSSLPSSFVSVTSISFLCEARAESDTQRPTARPW